MFFPIALALAAPLALVSAAPPAPPPAGPAGHKSDHANHPTPPGPAGPTGSGKNNNGPGKPEQIYGVKPDKNGYSLREVGARNTLVRTALLGGRIG